MTKVNTGHDQQAATMAGEVAGVAGTATSTTATTVVDTGAPFTASAYIGHLVQVGAVYGVVISNTTTTLTVDRWYTPTSPGGVAASTPSGTAPYLVLPGNAPAWYTALTANTTGPAGGDTALTGEITTAGGGLIKKLSTYAHTGGTNTYTLTTVFTANGSDSLPVTIGKIGVFNSIVASTGRMVFETLVSPTATLSASGDQLTLTQTVTM